MFKQKQTFQLNNDPKHISQTTDEFLKKKSSKGQI